MGYSDSDGMVEREMAALLLGRLALNRLNDALGIDWPAVLERQAVRLLKEVQSILRRDELTDFEIVEELVCLFEHNGFDAGATHDFG